MSALSSSSISSVTKDANSLRYACELGYLERVRALVVQELNLDTRYHNGHTALHAALINYHPDVALLLIESGANVHLKDHMGFSAFHYACRRGYLEVVKALFERGVDINTKDINSNSPLLLACKDGCLAIPDFLIDVKAALDTQDKYGMSALHYAVTNACEHTALRLVTRGADVHLRNKRGVTPLQMCSLRLRNVVGDEMRWHRRRDLVMLTRGNTLYKAVLSAVSGERRTSVAKVLDNADLTQSLCLWL